MKTAYTAEWLAIELCKKLGIEPDGVTRMIIDMEPGEPARIYVGLVAGDEVLNLPWNDKQASYQVLKVKD